ncbi:MAG TPA: hypothetical protein VNI81_09120, partial [Candidatus Limnocylindrales bacterium]|nr:hypothetical protein [Candidatus Limnocylindrales bacterium]
IPKPRAPALRQVRRALNNLFAPCPRETGAQFPELRRVTAIAAPAARDLASPCAPNNQADRVEDLSHRVPQDPVARVDPAVAAPLASVRVRRLRVRVLAHVRPALALECCRRRSPKSRPRRSPASPFTRASLSSASAPWLISAKWKASASSTRRVSVPEQAAAE